MLWSLFLVAGLAQPGAEPLEDLLEQALRRLDAAEHAEARELLMRARDLHPGSPLVDNFLGVVEADAGAYEKAELHFRDALARAPHYVDALLNLGRLYQENAARDPAAARKALAAYEQVLALKPGHADARFQTAALLQALGEFDRSLESLSLLPPAEQDRPAALAVRCADHAGRGERARTDAAAAALLRSPELRAVDIRPILPVLAAHDRGDLVREMLGVLRVRGWATPEERRQLGLLLEGEGDLAAARAALEEAALSSPADVASLLDLARVAHRQEDYEGALGYLGHARALEPENAGVHFFFGMVCVAMDLGAEAFTSLQTAHRLDPDHPSITYALAAVALHRADAGEAIPYFRRYSELRPEDPRGRFGVGIAAFRSADYETARRELGPAAERPETAAAARYFLARMAREEGDLDEALRLARRAIEADASYPDPYSELGFVHMRRGEIELAEQALERCLELDTDHYLATMYLAMLYRRIDDPRAAAFGARFDEMREQQVREATDFLRPIDVRPY